MKSLKFILAIVVAFAITAPVAVAQSTGTGWLYARDFDQWTFRSNNAVAAASASMVIQGQAVAATPGGDTFFPINSLSVGQLLDIVDGSDSETVEVTSVSCSIGGLPDTCSFTATFSNAHRAGVTIRSGTGGLQEAVNALPGAVGTVFVAADARTTAANITTNLVGNSQDSILVIRDSGADHVYYGCSAACETAGNFATILSFNQSGPGWASSIVFEGATADDFETTIGVVDPTADITYNFPDNSEDTYFVTAVRDGVLTEGNFWLPSSAFPISGAAAEDALASDFQVVCYRAFLPYPLTITEAVMYEFEVASAGASDFIGVAIYEDADAGTRLTTGATTFGSDGAALVIDLTDVTLTPDFYRFCATQNDVSAHDWLGYAQDSGEADVMNETVSELSFGLAANASTGDGVMPTTTGALSSSAESLPLIKFQTN